jgi:RNA polymerase sigma factor (sigma-70 family)
MIVTWVGCQVSENRDHHRRMLTVADAELVERSRKRDAEAFGELVERHQRLVFGVALARCGDPALAEDVAQEAFVTAWHDLDRLRDDARVGTWVAGIARNIAASAARTRARRSAPLALELAPVPTPEDAALAREERELLACALRDVPKAHREVLVLYYLEGHSVGRIAELLGITEDLVHQRLSRGRRALREGVANRVESALARVRSTPALRVGVVAALTTAGSREAAAATTVGKVIAIMTIKKVAMALAVLAIAGGGTWLAVRGHGDAARADAPQSSTAAASAASGPTGHAHRIDRDTRATLLDAIRRAHRQDERSLPGSGLPAGQRPSSSGPRPQLANEEPDLDKDYLRHQMREIIPLLTECYEKELVHDPHLAGTVTVKFTIEGAPDVGGLVTASSIDESTTLSNKAVQECIQETMYALEIAAPTGGGVVNVTFPFTFSPATDDDAGH